MAGSKKVSSLFIFLLIPLFLSCKIVFAEQDEIGSLKLTTKEKEWLLTKQEVTIGVDKHWFPYEFQGDRGEYLGIAADYLDFASKVLGIEFKVVETTTWNQAFELFKDRKIDLIPAIIPTEERKKTILFSKPYFVTPTVIVSRKNAFYANSIESLEGKKLALVKGFAIVEYVSKDHPEIEIILVDSIKQGLDVLNQGKVDAYIGAISGINSELNRGNFEQLIISAFTPFDLEVAMAVSENATPLAGILDKVFASMNNRHKASIENTWLSIQVEQGISIEKVLLWGLPPIVILSMITLIIFRLNRGLKKEIERRKSVEEELKHQAQHDILTGLPNRRMFEELSHFSLAKAKREQEKHAVLFIDIDGFKGVNDRYGHFVGDELLKVIAKRITRVVRSSDIVARLGGDEFLVLLNSDANLDLAENVSQKIIDELMKPFSIIDKSCSIGASIGIAVFPDQGEELEELIRLADDSMYQAKKNGKNSFANLKPTKLAN